MILAHIEPGSSNEAGKGYDDDDDDLTYLFTMANFLIASHYYQGSSPETC